MRQESRCPVWWVDNVEDFLAIERKGLHVSFLTGLDGEVDQTTGNTGRRPATRDPDFPKQLRPLGRPDPQ
jgi:hypothetical protein